MSKVQDLNFELMELASFNSFDGKAVVADLKKHQELWHGAVMGRFVYSQLIALRDISGGDWNVDTLMILSSGKNDGELELLAKSWEADEVDWLSDEEADRLLGSSPSWSKVLRVWWD